MTLGLTKEDVSKLPPEDQEAIGGIALEDARVLRETLAAAKGYRGMQMTPYVLMALGITISLWKPYFTEWAPFLFFGMVFLIQYHVHGVNRRIDAVLRLMDERREAERGSDIPV